MNNDYISVSDSETFATIDEVFEKVFSSKNPLPMKGYFEPLPSFAGTELAGHHIWFPKLAKTKNGNFIPATDTALNQISDDGEEIVEMLPKESICNVGDKKIGDKCLKIKSTDNAPLAKILSMLFFFLLLASPNLVSCSSAGSDIHGTYELMLEGNDIYKALTIDSDSIILSEIRPCDFSVEYFTAGCAKKDFSKMDLNAAKKELDTLTMVRKIKVALRVTAYEPFENKNVSTKGSYPNGYTISAEGDYLGRSVIAQLFVLKHAKDKGRVIILSNAPAVELLGLPSGGGIEVNNKLSLTGKSVEKHVSKVLETYKKAYKEKYKNFIEDANAYRIEMEKELKHAEEIIQNRAQAEKRCQDGVKILLEAEFKREYPNETYDSEIHEDYELKRGLVSECVGCWIEAYEVGYNGGKAEKYVSDCMNKINEEKNKKRKEEEKRNAERYGRTVP